MQNISLIRGECTKLPNGRWEFAVNPYANPNRMVVPADVPLGVLEHEVDIMFRANLEKTNVEISYQLAKCGSVQEMRSVPPLILQSTQDLHLLFRMSGGTEDVQLFVTFKQPTPSNVPSSSRIPIPASLPSQPIISDSSLDDENYDYSDWYDSALDDGDSSNADKNKPVSEEILPLSPEMFQSMAAISSNSTQLAQGTPVRRRGKEIARNLFGNKQPETHVAGSSRAGASNVSGTAGATANNIGGNIWGSASFIPGQYHGSSSTVGGSNTALPLPDFAAHNIGSSSRRSYWDKFSDVMSALAKQLAAKALNECEAAAAENNDEVSGGDSIFYRDAAPYSDDGSYDVSDDDDLDINVLNEVRYEGDGLYVGKVYKNKSHCKIKLAVNAINRKFNFRCIRSNRKLLVVTCTGRNCGWRVRAGKMGSTSKYQIRKANLIHTCTIDERVRINPQATTAIIRELVKSKYNGECVGPRPRELQQLLFADYNISISYWKAWHAREVAMERVKGSSSGSYALLPFYVHLLKHFNPCTICNLDTEGESGLSQRFKSLFLAFGASIQGWYYLRKLIVVDGTHLLGKYQGCLLTACAQDGNHQVFPLAFGVVDGENDSSWQWFFKNLKEAIPDGYDIVFVSDRHSSISKAIEKEYPLAKHVACIVHLTRNVRNLFKNTAVTKLVGRAARTFTKVEFARLFQEIQILDGRCADYLLSIGIPQWSRAYCEGERYNVMTSNIAESVNNVLMEAREYHI